MLSIEVYDVRLHAVSRILAFNMGNLESFLLAFEQFLSIGRKNVAGVDKKHFTSTRADAIASMETLQDIIQVEDFEESFKSSREHLI